MFNFLDNNKTNKTFQKGSTALIIIGALLIITAAALGVFNDFVPKTTVEVETPKTKAEQFTDHEYGREQPEYLPGEIVVKFKDSVDDKIGQTIGINLNITGRTISAFGSVNQLNQKYQAEKIEPVFKSLRRDNKIIKSLDRINEIKAKFPTRAKRAPKDTKVPKLENIYKITLSKNASIEQIIQEYSKDSNIEYAEPNYVYHLEYTPNDPRYTEQWAHNNNGSPRDHIQSELAWDIEKGNADVILAFVDTGVDYNHEDLKTNVWINPNETVNGIDDDQNGYVDDIKGWDFYYDDNDPMDGAYHGTHTAGIASAIGNNGIGVIGICLKCKIMPLKVVDNGGKGFFSDMTSNAIMYATNNGATIISNSWGGYSYSSTVNDAIQYAISLGVLIVASAGNDALNTTIKPHYPSDYNRVLSVASVEQENKRSSFSNYGLRVDVAAPGGNILSTMPNNQYAFKSGTSMAAPLVSGLAGLILSKNPNLTNEEVKQILVGEVDEFASDIPAPDQFIGRGRINALKTLQIGENRPYKAEILSPSGSRIFLTQEIKGVANGDSYMVKIGEGQYPSSWQIVQEGTQDQNNYITSVDTTQFYDGIYTIKLEVNGDQGIVSDRVTVEIDNVFIKEPNKNGYYKYGNTVNIIAIAKHQGSNYTIDYAPTTAPNQWSSAGLQYTKNGEVITGTWDTSMLSTDGIYILRLRSTYEGVESADQLEIGLEKYQAGWPQKTDGRIFGSSPVVADIDKDGDKEIILGTTAYKVYVWNHDGSLYPGWPQDMANSVVSTVAVGNIDDDKELEIIVNQGQGQVYAFNYNGSKVDGWPINVDAAFNSSPVIYKNIDGSRKILIGTYSGGLAMLNPDGTKYNGFTNNVEGGVFSSPAYADIVESVFGNEIVVKSCNPCGGDAVKSYVYLLGSDGSILQGWPQELEKGRLDTGPVLGDIDNDGKIDIIIADGRGKVYAWNLSGHLLVGKWGLEDYKNVYNNPLALGNVNNDLHPELLVVDDEHSFLYAIGSDGTPYIPTLWQTSILSASYNNGPSIGDIDNDGNSEIIIGTYNNKLFVFNHDQSILNKWPKSVDSRIETVPSIDDVDGDGDVEIVVATFNGVIYIYDLDGRYDESKMEWPMFQHDQQHTGNYNFGKEIVPPKPVPLLFLTTPKDGDIVAPKSKVSIIAEVSDEIKAQTERVEFYVNGARKCQDKSAPYSCNWQAPKKSGQTYELQAKAYGNKKLSGIKPIAESEIIKVKAEKSANAKDES